MKSSFLQDTSLQYQLRAARAELAAFRSGDKYVQMQADFQKKINYWMRRAMRAEAEAEASHRETISVRNQWFQVYEDLEKEFAKKEKIYQKKIKDMEKRALKAEQRLNESLDKISEQRKDIYRLGTELEEEKGKNLKLKAQINRDYENSSTPSSKSVKHKKIANSREKTGRKPGGQTGHKGHCRKKQEPNALVILPPPQEVLDDPGYRKTSRTIVKQMVGIRILLDVTEYHADVYYNRETGERIHAAFPSGVVDDVNYDGSIKAFLFLLNNDCCVSIDKSRKFLSDLTDGKLDISKGMVNRLSRELAMKTQEERKKLYGDILLSPVMHTDCTNARINGKSAYVFICATPDGKALYFAREKKGHEGVKGTVTEDYQGIVVQDHEKTFYRYGSDHQECLAHVLRYLKDSMDNEPDREWNKQMRTLIQEMIHYRNSVADKKEPDAEEVAAFEQRYTEILQKAGEEYEYIPPNMYYREGYNLYLRMKEYMHNHLLFLHNHQVPPTNNEAERLLRSYKRKQQQAMTFRSQENLGYLCECMSVLVMMRQNENNTFDRISQMFG